MAFSGIFEKEKGKGLEAAGSFYVDKRCDISPGRGKRLKAARYLLCNPIHVVLYDRSRVMAALVPIGKQGKFCSLAEDLYGHFLLLQSFLDCRGFLSRRLEDVHRKAQSICAD